VNKKRGGMTSRDKKGTGSRSRAKGLKGRGAAKVNGARATGSNRFDALGEDVDNEFNNGKDKDKDEVVNPDEGAAEEESEEGKGDEEMNPEEEENDIRPPTRDEVLKELKELETELIRGLPSVHKPRTTTLLETGIREDPVGLPFNVTEVGIKERQKFNEREKDAGKATKEQLMKRLFIPKGKVTQTSRKTVREGSEEEEGQRDARECPSVPKGEDSTEMIVKAMSRDKEGTVSIWRLDDRDILLIVKSIADINERVKAFMSNFVIWSCKADGTCHITAIGKFKFSLDKPVDYDGKHLLIRMHTVDKPEIPLPEVYIKGIDVSWKIDMKIEALIRNESKAIGEIEKMERVVVEMFGRQVVTTTIQVFCKEWKLNQPFEKLKLIEGDRTNVILMRCSNFGAVKPRVKEEGGSPKKKQKVIDLTDNKESVANNNNTTTTTTTPAVELPKEDSEELDLGGDTV